MNLESGNFEFHGTQATIVDLGTVSTERDGLQSCTSTYKIRKAGWNFLPKRKSKHPVFWNLLCDRAEVSFSGPYAIATCTFFGIETESSTPIYDLSDNVNQEPISTHPDFVKTIGGTAQDPKNGAVFRRVGPQNENTYSMVSKPDSVKYAKANPGGWVFDHFELELPNNKGQNPFAGVTDYLEPGLTWRKSWCQRKRLDDLAKVGKIDIPEGDYPDVSPRTWLLVSATQQDKSGCFQCTKEWRTSGLRGWIPEIYEDKTAGQGAPLQLGGLNLGGLNLGGL